MRIDFNKRRIPKNPFPELDLSKVGRIDCRLTRQDVGDMFGLNPSMISKDCQSLGIESYQTLNVEDIWKVYCLRVWMVIHPLAHRKTYIAQALADKDSILKEIELVGGGRDHFEQKLEDYLAKVKTKKLVIA